MNLKSKNLQIVFDKIKESLNNDEYSGVSMVGIQSPTKILVQVKKPGGGPVTDWYIEDTGREIVVYEIVMKHGSPRKFLEAFDNMFQMSNSIPTRENKSSFKLFQSLQDFTQK